MSSTHNPLAWIDDALADLDRASLRRRFAVRSSPQAARVVLDGHELINFGSNDYLGLASDPRLIEAAYAACQREGWGGGASTLVSGRSASQAALEKRLSEFEGTEAALVFSTGFAANAGIIPALVDEQDAIFGDAKNHASLIDGCRLSKAARFVYPHCDCDALETKLRDAGRFRRRLIVTDTVFSMDGDLAPVARIAELAEKYDAMLMLDEAHATGVFGPNGRGVSEHAAQRMTPAAPGSAGGRTAGCFVSKLGTPGRAGGYEPIHDFHSDHIRIGTLSKALGSVGGFVCGRQTLIDWLANRARTLMFSTANPAAISAAGIAAIDIVQSEPFRRQQLLTNAADFRSRLNAQGWNTGDSESQIIPLVIGEPDRTMKLAASLRDAGYFIPAIRSPTVPEGESLLRLSLCYHHTPEMIGALLDQLARLR